MNGYASQEKRAINSTQCHSKEAKLLAGTQACW